MLRAQHRITRGEDYRRVIGRGRKSRTPLGFVNTSHNSLGHLRFGFVVSKAVGNAVVRNRVKRRLRAAAQRLTGHSVSMDVVVRSTAGAAAASVDQAEEVFREVLGR
ncbi:MAG: ribonuclease P protein component [Pontimonas sp.]